MVELIRLLEIRKMPAPVENREPGSGNRRGIIFTPFERRDLILLAPHKERRSLERRVPEPNTALGDR
jgi:hypothetical protein